MASTLAPMTLRAPVALRSSAGARKPARAAAAPASSAASRSTIAQRASATATGVALAPAASSGGAAVAGAPVLIDPTNAVTALVAVAGALPGEGYATLPINAPPSLPSGAAWFGQWFVCDSGAPGGVAASRGVQWIVP